MALAAAIIPACGSSGGGGGGSASGGSAHFAGGRGTNGDGGYGGYWEIYQYFASDIRVVRSASFDTTFDAPTAAPYLGTNPLTISATSTATVVAALSAKNQILAGATANTMYGDDGATAATGLWIKSGVTYTIPANYDFGNEDADANTATGTKERCYLEFDYGIYIQGKLVIGHVDSVASGDGLGNDSPYTELYGQNLVITGSGSIVKSGRDLPAATNGGNSGSLYVYADYTIINRGTIDTTGGDGLNGGDGGYVQLESDQYNCYNLGTVTTNGGRALDVAGIGGDAGGVDAYGSYNTWVGGVFNTGSMLAQGGNGPGGGGDGADIYLLANYAGVAGNTGTMNASGGNATTDGNGGDAGTIEFDVYGGSIRVKGTLKANGGNGAGTGDGGDGNWLYFYPYEADDYPYSEYNSSFGVWVAASMEATGGQGENGGDAGGFYVSTENTDTYHAPNKGPIVVAVSSVDLSAGNGSVNGNDTGYVYLDNYGGNINDDAGTFVMMSIINEASFNVNGGNGTSGYGGSSDYFEMYDEYTDYADFDRVVKNTGTINQKGGNGDTNGGDGGDVWCYGYENLWNSGAINTSGGTGNTSYGGDAGYVEFECDGTLTNSGSLTSNGGTSTADDGGSANYIELYGLRTVSTGNLTANGGNGGTGAGDVGGDSGYIEVHGGDVPSKVTGTFTSKPGTGTTDGTADEIWILGVQLQ